MNKMKNKKLEEEKAEVDPEATALQKMKEPNDKSTYMLYILF